MNYLKDVLKNDKEYLKLLDSLSKEKNNNIYVHGLVENTTGHFSYSIDEELNRPVFVVCENEYRAKKNYTNIKGLDEDNIFFLPTDEFEYGNVKKINNEIKIERLKVFESLLKGKRPLIFTTLRGLSSRISNKELLSKSVLNINMDSLIDINELIKKLLFLGYEQAYSVENAGEFAIRGGILDIYTIGDGPIRIELFGDEVDSIRKFDIQTKRSIENISDFDIYPFEEILIEDYDEVLEELKNEVNKDLKKNIDRDRLKEKFFSLIELAENGSVNNRSLLIPYLKDKDNTILDLTYKPIIVFEDLARIYENGLVEYKNQMDEVSDLLEKGELLHSHQNIYFNLDELINKFDLLTTINISQLLKRMKVLACEEIYEIKSMEVEKFHGDLSKFSSEIVDLQYKGYKIMIFTGNISNSEKIKNFFNGQNINFEHMEDLNGEIKSNQVYINDLAFNEGFIYPKIKTVIFSEEQIYGKNREKRIRKKTVEKKDIINYEDLEIGDLVVHDDYGIGRYEGLENLSLGSKSKDFLKIQYQGMDKLYVPAEEMNYISKYMGGSSSPRLSKLGSTEWKKSTYRVKKEIEEIADDLVKLYSERSSIEGYAFPKDTAWQKDFENSFVYQETPSQLRASEEIKEDMESASPMDRLLCGDVGYGKTEVALRAAFKAVMDDKQVAFLVPTTILCQQHFETMVERLKNFPVNIDYLSRFKTSKDEKETKKNLKAGRIDIIVGTHKLLSEKVKFQDLGLLIIDEEQRFGVKDKEKIKQLKKNVDVLTLSATPIPRTLQMSLTGIRDLSMLEEPPEERRPINTYVTEFDPPLIREAILKEISRDGQIYFVYNKVYDINNMFDRIQSLVPEARIVIGHGQMSTRELEKVMVDFKNHEYDILLSTTIIETGMDIENVNTMIIYNSDNMGLSQLYQLKGRIGRGRRSSYAYFTYERGKVISELSEKRLKAIKDFSSFGSGYKIAMRDLELRGAGNILGESQSGHIDSVGYEFFVRMLEEEINKLKGIKTKEERLINIVFKVDTFIPSSYIEDDNYKLTMYKDIANIKSRDDLNDIVDTLYDVYGDIPEQVMNIINIAYIKSLALKTGVSQILEENEDVIIEFMDDAIDLKDIQRLSLEFSKPLRLEVTGNTKIIFDASDKKILDSILILEMINEGE